MSKLVRVQTSKYRVVLTDLLPYERPVFFTNRFFARFLRKYGVRTDGERLIATNENAADGQIDELLNILSGENDAQRACYQYTIAKNNNEGGRLLSIIHPFHQVRMVEFYDKYKTVLVDFCTRSHFSIRYPYRVAKYHKQGKCYPTQFDDRKAVPEGVTTEKSYFAYKEYRNINAFYDDYRFLRAEKHFDLMYKVDLEHCFETVNAAQLARAMFNDDQYNQYQNIASDFKELQESFGNKDNGIIIGPEFSRIFAEIILQRIDLNIEKKLEKRGLKFKRDYVLYRYVDDGFIFCKNENDRKTITEVYDECMAEYGLKRKEEKCCIYTTKPFLDNISMAKYELNLLVKDAFQNRLITLQGYVHRSEGEHGERPFCLDVKNFLKSYRMIMARYQKMEDRDKNDGNDKDNGSKIVVLTKEIMGYLLAQMRRETTRVIEEFDMLYREYCETDLQSELDEEGKRIKSIYEDSFVQFALNLTEILFYLFSVDRRMVTSAKVVRIINMLQLYVRGRYVLPNNLWAHKFSSHSISALDKKISDETHFVLENTPSEVFNHLEILNLLELQKDMFKANRIRPISLKKYIKDWTVEDLDFFTAFELFHFTKNDDDYKDVNEMVGAWIEKQFKNIADGYVNTETVLTLLEVVATPYIDKEKKETYLNHLATHYDVGKLKCEMNKTKELFIKWHKYNLYEQIQTVNSEEAY